MEGGNLSFPPFIFNRILAHRILARHQLAPGEIMPAARGAVAGQMAGTQVHGQDHNTCNDGSGGHFSFIEPWTCQSHNPSKKGFYRAK